MLNDSTFDDPWEAAFEELAPSPAEVEAEREYLRHLDHLADYDAYCEARAEEAAEANGDDEPEPPAPAFELDHHRPADGLTRQERRSLYDPAAYHVVSEGDEWVATTENG